MSKKILLVFLAIFFLPLIVHAQGSPVNDTVTNQFGQPVQGVSVTICTSAGTGQPCTPLASIYSDQALTQALPNPLTTNSLGQYSFWIASGTYIRTITGMGLAPQTTFFAAPPLNAAIKPAASDAYFYVSGNGSDTAGDGLSGGSAYATWAKAKTSCGATPCVVTILETAALAGCPDGTATIVTFDYRALATPCGNNDISLNSGPSTGASHSLFRVSMTRTNPSSGGASAAGDVANLDFATFNGTLPNGISIEAHTAEAQTVSSITPAGVANLLGEEGAADINSTGGTLTAVYGVLGHVESLSGSTTNVTEAASVRGLAPTNAGTGAVTNAYGGHFSQPSIGSTDNYAVYADGSILVDNDSVASGINFVGSSGSRFPIITETNANDAILFRPVVASVGFSFQDAIFDHWLDLNSSGAKLGSGIPLMLTSPGGGTITHQAPNTASNFTITDPAATGNAVVDSATQTETNKTLTSPVLNTPTINGSGGALTLPAGPDTLIGRATTDTLTNKTLTSPAISSPTTTGTDTGTETLTNKTLTSPVLSTGTPSSAGVIAYDGSGHFDWGDGTVNRIAVSLDQTQTLTNKTLTTPTIATILNTGTLTLPTSTDTLVGRATTDTLTNKTFDSTSNVNLKFLQNSAATNFGVNLSTQTIVASVPQTGAIFISASAIVSAVGTGSCGSQSVSGSISFTAPGGSSESLPISGLSFSGVGILDTGSVGGSSLIQLTAKAGTAITYTTTSSTASCTTPPQYTVYAKASQ